MKYRKNFQRMVLPNGFVNPNEVVSSCEINSVRDDKGFISGYFVRNDSVYRSDKRRLYLGGGYHQKYFTYRQLQVLYWLLMGKKRSGVADKLSISIKTVEFHCENIKLILEQRDQAKLVPSIVDSGLAYVIVDIIENGYVG